MMCSVYIFVNAERSIGIIDPVEFIRYAAAQHTNKSLATNGLPMQNYF